MDTDTPSHQSAPPPLEVLKRAERNKRRKYLLGCQKQRQDFTPFVVSADGLIGKDTDTFIHNLAFLLAAKLRRPYAEKTEQNK